MTTKLSEKEMLKIARRDANELNVPMVVYQDFRGGFQITELHQYRLQITIVPPQLLNNFPTPSETGVKAEYFLCGLSENGGQTFIGKPEVFTAAELAGERRKIAQKADNRCGIIVITEIEIGHPD